MTGIYRTILIHTLWWLSMTCSAQVSRTFIVHPEQNALHHLNTHLSIYEDTSRQLSFQQITQPHYQSLFKPYNSQLASPLNPQYVYWGKLTLLNKVAQQNHWILQAPGHNSSVEVYIYHDNGEVHIKKAGQFVAAADKDINEATYSLIPLHLPYNQPHTVYIRIATLYKEVPSFDLKLYHPASISNYREWKRFTQGLFQGFFWILILYNLLLFFTTRNTPYGYYSLYLFFIALYSLYFQGFVREHLLGYYTHYNSIIWLLSVNGTSIAYYLFLRSFLHTPRLIPTTDVWIRYYIVIRLGALFVELTLYYGLQNADLTNLVTLIVAGIDVLFSLTVLTILYRTKDKAARYFIGGGLFLYTTVILLVFTHGYSKLLYAIIYQVGTTLEILVFSLGLGYKTRKTEHEKQDAQQALIDQLHEKDELQRQHAEELESKVLARTNEVRQQQEELLQQTEHLIEANLVIEEKNNKINESINAASNIQAAILPRIERIKKSIPELFIFFKPLDIVSGDFYWFGTYEDNLQGGNVQSPSKKIVLAAVDCTGHGIPGAFMSILGDVYLNHLVNIEKITAPDIILNRLHKGIRHTLKQDITLNRNGMDVSLVVIDPERKTLDFAGAKNSLLYVQNGILTEVKGDKQSVGGEQREKNRIFSSHTIDIQSSTMIYLYSDGYQDQFGGANDKKFMKKHFRKLLFSIHQKTAAEQHDHLETTLNNWMGKGGQIDDILVLGARLEF
ncbi:7TM diverse intracellular signaling domain-containing protein [Microscilla marina]|uniref:Membrane protein, putative n=1 Tax=Microscilla marina ATCC 23134 TaxID=313606 RepID=A1ZGX5_MICM2|nr:7TM diverse intracellular signaling domain-containing protein [Microscilla marina]EAY30244.1 membrane protein, putative [Microscilla marina ATCC 23134]